MAKYSDRDKNIIRSLLAKYRRVRGYSYDQLATAVGLKRGDGSHLFRLENPSEKWPGLRTRLAINLHLVLRFGDVATDWDPDLSEEDYNAWFGATHVEFFIEELHRELEGFERDMEGIVIEHRGQSLLRKALNGLSAPAYVQKWGRARWTELQFNFRDASILLGKAIAEAINFDASPHLLGIMLQDQTEAYIALGNLKQAKIECERSERAYLEILKSGVNRDPSVQLGLGRAKIQRLQMAVVGGEDEEECNTCFEDARRNLLKLEQDYGRVDHYGWAKTLVLLGYLHVLEEKFDLALDEAQEAYSHATQITTPMNAYWLIRDGLFLGRDWMKIHAIILQRLIVDLRFAMRGELMELPQIHEAKPWWAKKIPPTFHFYAWRSENGNPGDMPRMVKEMEQLHFVQYLPLVMMAYGDFLAKVEGSIENALTWHERAREIAVRHGLHRQARLAERRITQYQIS